MENVPSVLVIAYAFPPLQVPMTPVVARLIAGLHRLGFVVDVISAHPCASSVDLSLDNSLLDYVNSHCRRVQRLHSVFYLPRFLSRSLPFLRHFPDIMGAIHKSAFRAVMDSEPSLYNAVITISPFHSVNPLMVRVKRIRPNVRWIAHFGDPWASNPLENRWLARQWNTWREAQTLRSATYVTHSSPHALELALDSSPFLVRERTRVIPHEFDSELYPSRPKRSNDKITLRFIGTLFGRRSPTPLFLALAQLQERCPEILEAIKVELIGPTDRPLSAWEGFGNLPLGLVLHRPAVNYLESLALMYDADILLVIEADVAATPFVPSKLMDYMGANTPIIGIAPRGGCREILDRLACPTVNPNDIAGIAMALETSIDRIRHRVEDAWCREEVRRSFDLTSGTADFKTLIMDAVPQ